MPASATKLCSSFEVAGVEHEAALEQFAHSRVQAGELAGRGALVGVVDQRAVTLLIQLERRDEPG
jgi:hypothetical protein